MELVSQTGEEVLVCPWERARAFLGLLDKGLPCLAVDMAMAVMVS